MTALLYRYYQTHQAIFGGSPPAANTMLWGAANNMQWGAGDDMNWG